MGKKAKRPLKVLQAPLDHANQAYVLSQALRARGVDSHLLRYQWESNPAAPKFRYEEDRVAEISRDDWFGDLLRNVQEVAAEGFDIIHFWDRTLLWRRHNDFFNAMDLPFLRLAGARFAYRFTGYELRRRSLELDINPFTPYRYGFENRFDEDDQKRYFGSLAPCVDAFVVQDPEVQTYCPEARIIPRALDLAQFPVPEPTRNKRPLVVHAPSEGKLKGSEFVIKAADVLKEEGLDFDFVLIENMPKTEALELCRRADIVIDQLLVGWYGMLSIEALAMGKTVIAYIRDDLTGYFGNGMPLVNANPQSIGTALREVVKDGELRRELGRRARAFVEEVHDSRVVARSAAKLYKKMLKAPVSRRLPDFGYQLSHSVDVARRLDADLLSENPERLSELEQRVAALRTARQAAESMAIQAATEHATEVAALRKIIIPLREKAERYDELESELPTLREKANHYNQLSEELPLLRRDARRYEELKAALPALRYKSKRYDELKNVALVWRAKADRFDRFAAKRWVRFVLPLLGLPLGFKSQRAHQPGSPKTAAKGRGGPRPATGGAAGQASEGDRAGGTVPGLKQPDTTSTPIVRQPVSQKTLAKASGAAKQFGVVAEVRAILRSARVPKRSTPRASGSAAKQGVAASPVIEQQTGPPVRDKSVVCIVTRKPISNITRAPRMAKVLVDAGYAVIVVSRGRPVPQLREMCPQVEYLEVTLGSFVRDLTLRCEDFRRRRANYRAEREAEYRAAMAKGGIRALARRLGRAAKAAVRPAASLSWRLFVVTPSALLLKKPSQRFALRWRELALHDAVGIAREFALVQNQRWSTHALADEADKTTRGRRFDIVQAYDSYALVAAARLAARDGAKLVYDVVELTSHRLALDLNLVERKRERAERREEAHIVREADGTIAIGEGLADWYARHYRRPRPVVVRNSRYYWPYQVDARLRADAGVGPEARLLVWCGLAYPQQGIEILIKALPHLAAHIHVVIIGFFQPRWKSYVQEVLPALAASLGVADRFHFLPAREPNDLVPYISGADVGVIPRSREYLNNFFSMPNKFLEMVMARLPIAVSQLGDMVDLISKYDMGGVFNERDSANIAAVIEGMLEPSKYALLKANVMKAAEVLTWENESLPYVALIDSLAPRHAGRSVKAGRAAQSERVGQRAPELTGTVVEIPGKPMPAGATYTPPAQRKAPGPAGLIEENQRLSARYERAVERIKRLQVTRDNLQILSRYYRDNLIVNHYLRFARYCYERAGDVKAEAYVAHGVEVLPSADVVAKAVGGRVYCDVIEMPSFAQRSVVYDWHPTNMSLLNHAFEGYLRGAAGLSTVGWALGRQLQHFGPRVTVIPNYRRAEPLQRSDQIRERCGLGKDDRLLLASNTIASGLEPIIEALKLLPDNVHLATLGNIFREYRGQIQATVARLGVENRVHFFDPVPYDQFAIVASGANIGLIAIDPSLMHWQISLPNRLFDCIAAGLPIVTPNVPDIARIVEGRRIGVTLTNSDAGSWADAITAALAGENALRPNVRAASETLVWESLGDKLHAAYDHAASITIIGFTNLIGHQRTIRMADTLIKRGVKVTICCPHEGQVPVDEMPGIRVVSTPKPQPGTTPMKAPAVLAAKTDGAGTAELPSAAPSAAGNVTPATKANLAAPVLALSAFASAPKFRDGPTTVVEEP